MFDIILLLFSIILFSIILLIDFYFGINLRRGSQVVLLLLLFYLPHFRSNPDYEDAAAAAAAAIAFADLGKWGDMYFWRLK